MPDQALVNSDLQSALAEARQAYIERNPKSLARHQEACEAMPGGNTRTTLHNNPFPLTVVRGEGCRLWDADGHDYIDVLGEYTAGTNPRDPASVLKLETLPTESATNTVLFFQGVQGKSYTLQYSDRLPALWSDLTSFDPLPASSTVWVTNQAPAGTSARFYRVLTPRLP